MKKALACLLLLAATSGLASTVQSPSQFLGFEVGADRKLADYRQIASYFRALEKGSPRVAIEVLGKTTLGEEMIMAILSSEENIRNLTRIREGARRLADPRGATDAQIDQLVREGKTVVLVTCNIHSTEIAASQFAMEWAHALATAGDAETNRRLANVVLLLVPSLNPDGQTMITEWYRKYVGTRYEGGRMPWLYHHYVGHDNNRDWYMLTQAETRAMSRAIYHRWFPQIFVDLHQMGSYGPRMFIPPFADPVDPDVHPLIWREINSIGSQMALRLEQNEKSGLIYGYAFDAYWLGGTRNTGWWKNITGLLLEVASARIASPMFVEATELRGGSKGLIDYRPTINHPNPWKGGWWRMRDIMDYERIASDALLEIAADKRADFLRNVVTRSRAAIASAAPGEAYRIPRQGQHDWATAQHMAWLMAEHNVEVFQEESGDYWIPVAQPFALFIREMMEPQRYPEVRLQAGADVLRPYDVATWTLPLQMGVTVEKTTLPAPESLRRVTEIRPGTKESLRRQEKTRKPRVATYKPWNASMDEGWTRWLLDTYGFSPKTLSPQQVRGSLPFDAIILPDLHKEILATGRRRTPTESRYEDDFPPEYRDGLGTEGLAALKKFVEDGGTLIAFSNATEYVIENFNIPVRNALAGVRPEVYSNPGSLVRLHVRRDHPVTQSMPATTAAFLDSAIAFETTSPAPDIERRVLAAYPDDPQDVLLSGWIRGPEQLTRKAAAVAMTYGKGKIVLFGFRPQHRGQTHATFPMVFDAVYWSVR